jgi:hypothetical protein
MQHIKYKITFGLAVFAISVFAQPKKNNGGGLDTPGQNVEKDFDITLNESERIGNELSLPAVDTTVKGQTYNLSQRNLKVDYLPPKIRPIGMGSEKKKGEDNDGKNGYLKVGYGIPQQILGEAGYAINNEKYDAILALKHHSLKNKKVNLQQFNETGGKLNLGYHLNKDYAVGGHIGYNRKGVWSYGALPDTISNIEEGNLANRYNNALLGLKFYNTSKNDMDLTYYAGIDFSRLSDNFASKELNTDIKVQATKWFAEKHPLSLMLRTDFNKFDFLGAAKKDQLNNIYVVPSFTFHADAFNIKLGMNLISNNDEWSPNADLEATARVMGDRLAVFAGWKGDVQKNTYHTLSAFNPWVTSSIQDNFDFGRRMVNTTFQDYFGGVKGHWGAVDYNLHGGYKPSKNLAFFTQNANFEYKKGVSNEESGRFDVLYGDANITYFKGSLSAKINNFEIGGLVAQNIYSMKTASIAKPWHLPATDINGWVTYRTLQDKLKLKGQVFFQNGVPYLNPVTNQADNLDALIDVSLATEYNINEHFGMFLNINNLVNQKRQRWYNYPTIGTNILGGISIKF